MLLSTFMVLIEVEGIQEISLVLTSDEKEQYTITFQSAILKGKFSRNQFDLCHKKNLLSQSDVNADATLYLRETVRSKLAQP